MISRCSKRQRVDEGLERGAGLAPRQHAVDLARRPQLARRSRPRPAPRRWRCPAPRTAPSSTLRPRSSRSWRLQRLHGQALQRRASVRACCALAPAGPPRGAAAWRAKCGAMLLARRQCRRALQQRRSRPAARPSAGTAPLRLHRLQHAAGALRHALRRWRWARAPGPRRWPLRGRPARWGLPNSVCAQRVDADQLAAQRHAVEVGLQDLVLAPAALPAAWPSRPGRASAPRCARRPGRARSSSSRPASCMVSVEAPRVRVFHRLAQALAATARQSTPLCS